MKKAISLWSLCAIVFIAQAQPVINSTDVVPQIGENYGFRTFDATTIGTGPSGANVTWDYTTLASTGSATILAVDPASTTNGSKFPMADLATSSGGNVLYYESTASSFSLWGLDVSGNIAEYTDPDEQLVFPFTFNDVNTDNFVGTLDANIPGIGTVKSFRKGTTRIEADGYGTLMLPTGTFTDVLRVKLESDQIDSIRILFFDSIVNTTIETYLWYQAGTKTALMSISNVDSEAQPNPISTGTYLDNTVGIANTTNTFVDFNVALNQAGNSVIVKYGLSNAATVRLSLIDVLGKTVANITDERLNKGNYKEDVALGQLKSGIYFVRGEFGNQVRTRKLIVP